MSLTREILAHAATLPQGAVLNLGSLANLGPRPEIAQALRRLEQTGALIRIAPGAYLSPRHGRFGPAAPTPEVILRALSASTGARIARHGAAAAHLLGLTTQMPLRTVALTSGRTRSVVIAGQRLELRHAQEWKLLFPDQLVGDTLRALDWLGRNEADAALSVLRTRFGSEALLPLLKAIDPLPPWLGRVISSLGDG